MYLVKFFVFYSLILLRASGDDLGSNAKPGQYPFMVCIYEKKSDHCICSAALIQPRKAVTSASCFQSPSDMFEVGLDNFALVAGVVDIAKKTNDSMAHIVNYEHHCLYKKVNDEKYMNDVGIVETNKTFTQTSVKPARVIGRKDWYRLDLNDYAKRGIKCLMLGWKTPDGESKGGKDLQTVVMVPKDDQACFLRHRDSKLNDIGYTCCNIMGKSVCPIGFNGAILYCNNNVYGVRTEGKKWELSCKDAYFYLLSESLDDLNLLQEKQKPKSDASSIDTDIKILSLLALNLNLMLK